MAERVRLLGLTKILKIHVPSLILTGWNEQIMFFVISGGIYTVNIILEFSLMTHLNAKIFNFKREFSGKT